MFKFSFIAQLQSTQPGNDYHCHCEERSDVAISSTGVVTQVAPINIVHFRFSMLIGLLQDVTALLEIAPQGHFLALRAQGATARWASQ